MAIKLSSNPTCVLSDADNISLEQRQKINMNLTKGIPGSDIEGDKVTVINSDGEVEMKAYYAGGGGLSPTLYATASKGIFSNMPEAGLHGWYVLEAGWGRKSGSGMAAIDLYWEDTYMGPQSICHVTTSTFGVNVGNVIPVYTLFYSQYKNTATIKIKIEGDSNVTSPTIDYAKIYAL